MKKICISALLAAAALGWNGTSFALPVFKKYFDEKYIAPADANPDLKKAAETAKCNICHGPAAKPARNDYGKTLSKWLKKANFKAPRLAADPEGVKKEVMEALDKAERVMSPDGETFGSRLENGKLP
jgi:cytochrome c553